MLRQGNSFIRNSNDHYKLDPHINSISPVSMTVNERLYNFFSA